MKLLNLLNPLKKQTISEKIEQIENELSYNNSLSEKEIKMRKQTIHSLITLIYVWNDIQFSTELQKINNKGKEMIDLMDLSTLELLDIFDVTTLTDVLYKKLPKKMFLEYEDNPNFKKKIHKAVLYDIIETNEKKGIAKALLFAKTLDLDTSIVMKYSPVLERKDFNKAIKKYSENNGNVNISCYPNYFKENSKDRFNTENLIEVINKNKYYQKVY